MPIGKNSIKRVKNGGYSNVKTSAPDMENSTVITNISPEVIEVMLPKAEEPTPKKPAAKKTGTAKKCEKSNKNIQKKNEEQPTECGRDGFCRVGLGEALPDYLL